MNNLVNETKFFAMGAHMGVGQKRKYDGRDYIVHPIDVLEILIKFSTGPVTVFQQCAALLHDVVEDTQVTIEQVYDIFGKEVGDLVEALTDVSKPSDGNRKIRKQMDLEHTARGPVDAKSVKVADLISNAASIVQYDPNFARVFMHEKVRLLEALSDADPGLLAEAWRVVAEARLILHTNEV